MAAWHSSLGWSHISDYLTEIRLTITWHTIKGNNLEIIRISRNKIGITYNKVKNRDKIPTIPGVAIVPHNLIKMIKRLVTITITTGRHLAAATNSRINFRMAETDHPVITMALILPLVVPDVSIQI